MSPLDDIILDFMMEQDIPGASFALSKDGKLLYCQGEELISQEIIFDIVISQLITSTVAALIKSNVQKHIDLDIKEDAFQCEPRETCYTSE